MEAMKNTQSGFTLIELMVAMAMAGIVVGVIYAAYTIQTKIYTEQAKVAEMQQNIRAGITFLQSEVRMAGYNPEDINDLSCGAGAAAVAAPGIHTATATTFGFSMDLNGDGKCDGPGENVTYSIYTATDGIQKLGRKAPTNNQAVAENIDGINFVYFSSSEAPTFTPAPLRDVVAVQVSLLARASTSDRKAARTTSFVVPMPDASGAPTTVPAKTWDFTDSVSRRLLTATINCRNMGLN
ncbi:MAG: prepilin-type N-terminal cleavage/methylation domain-containing protein [Desulforhopalus sp.]|jgi:prepilin-type N-terminal cleavage/methylation domain-containing protein